MRIWISLIPVLVPALSCAQDAPPNPIVRDAFALQNDHVVRTARLSANLNVVVCQSELAAWTKALKPPSRPVLYLNGRLLKGVFAAAPFTIPASMDDEIIAMVRQECGTQSPPQILRFLLDPLQLTNIDTKSVWLEILDKPWENRPVAVSAGTDRESWPSDVSIDFDRIEGGWLVGWLVLFAIAAHRFFVYARNTDIIRGTGNLPAGTPPNARKAFSLGRTQMAAWTFIIAPALAFIFMVTWHAGAISNGTLILVGISFVTTLLASAQDGSSDATPTKGFWNDLVDDGTGPSIHRFQMLLFTAILMLIFIIRTATTLVMPDFDPSLLALMGISNSTYVGFKMQGK